MSLFGWIGKHPLETAALGAGAWFGAPALAGLFSSGAGAAGMGGGTGLIAGSGGAGLSAAAAGSAASPFALTAGGSAGLTAAPSALSVGSLAPSSAGLLGTAKEYARPTMEAMGAASAAKNLFSSNQPQIQPLQAHGDNGALNQIVQSDQQGLLAQQDADMKRRQQQMALIRGMNNG